MQIAGNATGQLKIKFVDDYSKVVSDTLSRLENQSMWTTGEVATARSWFQKVQTDLSAGKDNQIPSDKLSAIETEWMTARDNVLTAIQKELYRSISFPIVLNSTRSMKASDVLGLGSMLNGLSPEWQNPVWSSGSKVYSTVQLNNGHFASVVNALTMDGNLASYDIYYVPNNTSDGDTSITQIYRYLQISMGDSSTAWLDLAREVGAGKSLLSGPVNRGIKISFSLSQEDASGINKIDEADWGIIRLINDPKLKVERRDGGATWRFKINLEGNGHSGDVAFDLKLKNPLPELRDWPKQ